MNPTTPTQSPALTADARNEADCQWLRAHGTPALSLSARATVKEDFLQRIKDAVLHSLDTAMLDETGQMGNGWKDSQLPGILPAIERHAETHLWPQVESRLIAAEIARVTAEENAAL